MDFHTANNGVTQKPNWQNIKYANSKIVRFLLQMLQHKKTLGYISVYSSKANGISIGPMLGS